MGDARIFGDPSWLVMVIGAKASGKSCAVKYAIYTYARDFAYIVVLTPTALNGWYSDFLPSAHIHDKYNDDIIQKLVDKQSAFKKSGKDIKMLLVMDDILASPDIQMDKRKANIMNTLYAANQHYNISLMIVAQKLKGLPRLCRDNVDYVLLTRCMRSAWDDLYEAFGNTDKKAFYELLEDGTRDYRILLYKAQVKRATDHFKCFSVPPSFLDKRFRLVY